VAAKAVPLNKKNKKETDPYHIDEEEYEQLMEDIDSLRNHSDKSALRQKKKEQLALIAEELLSEQEKRELLWKQIQQRKMDELNERANGLEKL
jgi:hypothetical protein